MATGRIFAMSGSSAKYVLPLALLGLGATPAHALTQVSSFGSNPGALLMYKHVPSSMPSNAPLVVALHGCTQTAANYEASGWTALANTHKFYVVYPQQQSGNNSNKCFNWFEPGDITRGYGEALSIKQMVDNMKANHSIDSNRVFVTGLSAGGFMTTVMAATYPDVFRGAAPIAGGPYKCATTMTDAFSCMSPGFNKTPTQWGDLARSGYSGYSGTKPKISIWHGDQDYTVKVMNLTETMEQFTNYHGIDQTADASATIKGYPRKRYNNSSGVTLVETYTITGMGHGTPVDPGTAADQCGTAASYILDVNICSSYFIAQFFGILGGSSGGGDTGGGGTVTSKTFTSIATEDGYVKANADGSSPALGTYASLAIGRGSDAKYNRALLSFDTSAIPDTATITKAYVVVTYSSGSGDPWASPSGNSLVIDVKNGCFGGCGTETTDYSASPTASSVASIAKFTSGTKASSNFSSSGLSAINKTGKTQLKLRFASNPSTTAYVFIKEGTSASLVVEYQ